MNISVRSKHIALQGLVLSSLASLICMGFYLIPDSYEIAFTVVLSSLLALMAGFVYLGHYLVKLTKPEELDD